MSLKDFVELELRRGNLEKQVGETNDKTRELQLRLQRTQRDLTDFSGRLKYSNGLAPSEQENLRDSESRCHAAIAVLERDLRSMMHEQADATSEMQQLTKQQDQLLLHLRKKFEVNAVSDTSSNPVPISVSGGSTMSASVGFREIFTKMAHEIIPLCTSSAVHQPVKLFVHETYFGSEAAPHYAAWEQRTATAIGNAKEKVYRAQQNLVELVNVVGNSFPELSKGKERWSTFVAMIDESFTATVVEALERALWLYDRALSGKIASELFSVNVKLSQQCKTVVAPNATDLPNYLLDLVENKIFAVCPNNLISDVVSVETLIPSGKDAILNKCRKHPAVTAMLQSIRNSVARYGEELVTAVAQLEDQFAPYWMPDVTSWPSHRLKAARDVVEYEFGYVRRKLNGGAFQLNAFPLQDTLLSMLTTHIDAARMKESEVSDKALSQMIQTSTLASAKASSVPDGGLALALARHQSNNNGSPTIAGTTTTSKKKGGAATQPTSLTEDGFDALRFAEVLISNQLKFDATEAASRQKQEELAAQQCLRSEHPIVQKEDVAAVPSTLRSQRSTSNTNALPVGEESARRLVPLHTNRAVESSTSGGGRGGVEKGSSSSLTPTSAAMVSPRPNSTPVNIAKRGPQPDDISATGGASQTPHRQSSLTNEAGSQSAPRPSGRGDAGSGTAGQVAPKVVDGWTSSPSKGSSTTGGEAPSSSSAAIAKTSRTLNYTAVYHQQQIAPQEPSEAAQVPPSPIRAAQYGLAPPSPIPSPLDGDERRGGGDPQAPPARAGSNVRSILRAENEKSVMPSASTNDVNELSKAASSSAAVPRGDATGTADDEDDEYTLQLLLKKERESLDRIKVLKEKDEERRREAQLAHRRAMEQGSSESSTGRISPRSEYMALLAEQNKLDKASKEAEEREMRLRQAEEEARRQREQLDAQHRREQEEEDEKQRQWEEQLRRQREENERKRQKEREAAEAAEREALSRRRMEEEKRSEYQRELEERLAEELRRRAMQQQKEREDREALRLSREKLDKAQQESELQRQRISFERTRISPPPSPRDPATPPGEGGYDAVALRRKLSLPPVQPNQASSTDASGSLTPKTLASLASAGRKPNTAPLAPSGSAPTPRGNSAALVSSGPGQVLPRAETAVGQPTSGTMQMGTIAARQQQPPQLETSPLLADRSLLDEYKSYCVDAGIKPNSGLLKTLPSVVGDFATTINLDLNYIGVKGLQPLLQILRRNRGLKLLNLKDNNLENNEIRQLAQVLMTECGDALQHLDLSNNPISLAGGSALMDLVASKKSLTTIVLRGTLIQPKVVEKIVEAAESNRRRAAWSTGMQ